jgi:serine/threonine protein kinase
MPLAAGDRLGPYQIVSLIGVGGMGEVYRARDTRLDRIVAVKTISAEFDTPAAREQFDREARAISSLSAANICALYDVGTEGERAYLVMEYLEGETLADELTRHRIPIGRAIEYAIQIADALDRAHRHGVIHRDLKPGNIMITKSGIKLLDFGLAKVVRKQESAVAPAEQTHTMTAQAPLLGTCQYMAPELLEGKRPDPRCDIFAFGALLYEMITGRRAFQGKTEAITIANILEHDPPPISPSAEPEDPRTAALEHLVRTCLTKDPDERRQTAHDIVLELRWIAAMDPDEKSSGAGSPPRPARVWFALAALVLAVSLAAGLIWSRRTPPRLILTSTSILPPDKATFVATSLPALSPDGKRLAFAATLDGKTQLWIRELDSVQPVAMAGTENAYDPFWSPDSQEVAFFGNGKLRKVRVGGGPVLVVCDAIQGRGGSWSRNDTIVFAPSTGEGLYRVPANGGKPEPVTSLDTAAGEVSHRFPWFLPDGKHFLFTGRNADPSKTAIYVADLDSKQRQKIETVNSNAVYSPPGYLLYVRERTLMALPFDAGSGRAGGEPLPVAAKVDFITGNVQASFTASANGELAYYSGGGTGASSQMTWYDGAGNKLGTLGEPGSFVKPAISPDGSTVAVDRIDLLSGTTDVWQYDLARGTSSRITFDPRMDGYPLWDPKGESIVFSSNRDGHYQLYRHSTMGKGTAELLFSSPLDKFPSDWSRDGRYLLYYQIDPKTRYDLWVLPLNGECQPFPLLTSEFNEHRARISPDGRWIAYTSDETSRDELYVQSFPGLGKKWQVSVNGGGRPVWSRDGKQLFYIAGDRKLMVTAVKDGARFETSPPKTLFETHQSATRFFDVSPDGKRFLLIDTLPEPPTPPMNLLLNWTAAIKRP